MRVCASGVLFWSVITEEEKVKALKRIASALDAIWYLMLVAFTFAWFVYLKSK